MQYVRWIGLGASLLLCACGQRHLDNGRGDTNPAGELTGTPCVDASDCGGAACVEGTCADDTNTSTTDPGTTDNPTTPTSCVDDGDCATNAFCQYPTVSPWVSGTEGTCAAPCGQCPFGQTCYSGQCYTEVDCDPSLNSADCPPGEVCSTQTYTCSAPPETCYFNAQCPDAWVCNDGTCMDPNTIDLGGCSSNADCNAVAGCQGGLCTCDDGACRPLTGCDGGGDCPQGSYCAAGACLSAVACTGQDTCTPYGLVCSGGYCTNAPPCNNGTCPAGQICQTNYDPPACFPQGTNACVRDDQCPQGKYCELFTGQCLTGCRNELDCAEPTPYCGSAHQCTPTAPGTAGDQCSDDGMCPGGTVCAYDDPTMGIFCAMAGTGMPGITCTRSCRVVCDLLTAQIADTCPAGSQCGGADQMTAVIMNLFQTMFGATSTSASACY